MPPPKKRFIIGIDPIPCGLALFVPPKRPSLLTGLCSGGVPTPADGQQVIGPQPRVLANTGVSWCVQMEGYGRNPQIDMYCTCGFGKIDHKTSCFGGKSL